MDKIEFAAVVLCAGLLIFAAFNLVKLYFGIN
jgi:hypothetical protein